MKSVMIIDDEEAIVNLISSYLKGNEWIVATCSSGECYVDYNRAFPFDLVITDLVMKNISGTQLIQKYIPKHQKIIVMSGFIHPILAMEIYETENIKFLQKPFHAGHLQMVIDQLFPQHKLIDELRDLNRKRCNVSLDPSDKEESLPCLAL